MCPKMVISVTVPISSHPPCRPARPCDPRGWGIPLKPEARPVQSRPHLLCFVEDGRPVHCLNKMCSGVIRPALHILSGVPHPLQSAFTSVGRSGYFHLQAAVIRLHVCKRMLFPQDKPPEGKTKKSSSAQYRQWKKQRYRLFRLCRCAFAPWPGGNTTNVSQDTTMENYTWSSLL